MNSYAVIKDGVVENVAVWDGVSEWAPPAGSTAVLIPTDVPVGIGWLYDGSAFTQPA